MLETLHSLVKALMKNQITDSNNADYGAIRCDCCKCLHTRAGEAVFPLAVCHEHSEDFQYLKSAISLGNWLISKQHKQGFWFETPISWNGTTVFQLMSLAEAYSILENHLTPLDRSRWLNAITKAASWVCSNMSKRFANINYIASASAALMLTYCVTGEGKLKSKAQKYARWVIKSVNKEGFIVGEGGYIPLIGRGGVDIGYNLDMSLGALALYAVLSNDDKVKSTLVKSLKLHLNFMYPDGSIDNSWGSRSYKWTMYGSKTAHGCQMALELLSDEDPVCKEASQLNLNYLKGMIRDGLVGYGPHSWWDKSFVPCIYPTFNRANAIAFALHYSPAMKGDSVSLANLEKADRIRLFKSVNVCLVNTEKFKATITGYRPTYVRLNRIISTLRNLPTHLAPRNPFRGKIQTPTGGSLSYLWHRNFGVVQASSQAKYSPVEPMHMPKIDEIETLTPHIRVLKDGDIFANLYDLNVHIKTKESGETCTVLCEGKLLNERFNDSGLKFQYEYKFDSKSVAKTVILWGREKHANIEIVEPIIRAKNMQIESLDNKVILRSEQNECKFTLLTNNVELVHGQHVEKYWSPFPHLYAYPIKLLVNEIKNYPIVVKYNIELKSITD